MQGPMNVKYIDTYIHPCILAYLHTYTHTHTHTHTYIYRVFHDFRA